MYRRFALSVAACLIAVVASTSAAFAIDAQQLADEYNANRASFVQKYQGQRLSVSGRVYTVALDDYRVNLLSGPHIQLSGSFWRMTCYLNDADAKRAAPLSPGQPVTIIGTFVTAGELELSFAPCTFQ